MGANTSNINNKADLETFVVEYILKSTTKDIELIDDDNYRNSFINLLRNIIVKYIDHDVLDDVFNHIGGNEYAHDNDIESMEYNSPDVKNNKRLKSQHLAEFYYEIYFIFNKIKIIYLHTKNLLDYETNILYALVDEDEIELSNNRINNLKYVDIKIFNILGELFVNNGSHTINKLLTFERMYEIGDIIDSEINSFKDNCQLN